MMKMSGRIMSCCVALLLIFTTVSAVQQVLRSINDLDMDSRELLRWFANAVDIDVYGDIRLTFDPNNGDHGSHHYGNYERLLDPLPSGYQYYTLGNTNQRTAHRALHQGRNKARLIIRIREQNVGRQSQIIDRVYITQHYQEFDYLRSDYDPAQTYQITTSLLREIRRFPMAVHDNLLIYRANNFGSANTSQLWGTKMQAATRRNEQCDFLANENCAPNWLLALVVFILFIVFLSIVIFVNHKSKMSN